MTIVTRPISDETIDASPESPYLESGQGSSAETNDLGRDGLTRKGTVVSRIDHQRILQVDGVLSDMLLTLAASLWTGLAASLLFVLLVFVSNG